jgi:hypothetical protein
MNEYLFFIPIIQNALEQKDPSKSLREAFGSIHRMGQESRYAEGYQQFMRFMEEVHDSQPMEIAKQLLDRFVEDFSRPLSAELVVEKNQKTLATIAIEQSGGKKIIESIFSGHYQLRLDTGLVIWEGYLNEQELLWPKAFPTKALKMAADTGELGAEPTCEFSLMDGALILRVFAGIESGLLEIQWKL